MKNLKDEDFVICGYVLKDGGVVGLVLGVYDGEDMVDRGHVTLGVSREAYQHIIAIPRADNPFADEPNEETVWIRPELACTVKFIERAANGDLRQPVFKGLREDKSPEECVLS